MLSKISHIVDLTQKVILFLLLKKRTKTPKRLGPISLKRKVTRGLTFSVLFFVFSKKKKKNLLNWILTNFIRKNSFYTAEKSDSLFFRNGQKGRFKLQTKHEGRLSGERRGRRTESGRGLRDRKDNSEMSGDRTLRTQPQDQKPEEENQRMTILLKTLLSEKKPF